MFLWLKYKTQLSNNIHFFITHLIKLAHYSFNSFKNSTICACDWASCMKQNIKMEDVIDVHNVSFLIDIDMKYDWK